MDDLFNCIKHFFWIIVPPALIGMAGSAVRYVRKHRHEAFSWGAFVSGLVTAAFAGILMHCLCRGLNLNAWTTSAMIAMAGYSGGQILDLGQMTLLKWLERRVK